MDERPEPPPATEDACGAPEIPEHTMPPAEEVKRGFNAVEEFTVPVKLDQMVNGAPAASLNSGTEIPDLNPEAKPNGGSAASLSFAFATSSRINYGAAIHNVGFVIMYRDNLVTVRTDSV